MQYTMTIQHPQAGAQRPQGRQSATGGPCWHTAGNLGRKSPWKSRSSEERTIA